MRYTGSAWILSSGTTGSINCYYNIGTAYSANLVFNLNGTVQSYSCARDGVCVEDFSVDALCGLAKSDASGIYYDPDCGTHTWQNCGRFQLRDGSVGIDCNPIDNRSYNAHTQCVNPTDCVYFNSSGYNCVPNGGMLPVPGLNNAFIACRAGVLFNGTTVNSFCPEEYQWSTNNLSGTTGLCRYPVNRCATVCPQAMNFSSSEEFKTLCNGNVWNGSDIRCDPGHCPTLTQCNSFKDSFVRNKQCFYNTTDDNKYTHYCAPIIYYPEYQYHNILQVETN